MVLLLGLAAWAVWSVALPNYRPSLRKGESYGIDVSHHQGPIDWKKVGKNGIAFAYVKATEGGDVVDPSFSQNVVAAHAAHLLVGGYHFFTLCRPGIYQARNFLQAVRGKPLDLPPMVDIEFGGNCKSRPSRVAIVRELRAFIDTVESASEFEVGTYVLHDVEERYQLKNDLSGPIWQRRLFRRPSWSGWWVWQASPFAHVDGIAGSVDLDVANVDLLSRVP
jgi:lysozyme